MNSYVINILHIYSGNNITINTAPDKNAIQKKKKSLFLKKTYVVGTHKSE